MAWAPLTFCKHRTNALGWLA